MEQTRQSYPLKTLKRQPVHHSVKCIASKVFLNVGAYCKESSLLQGHTFTIVKKYDPFDVIPDDRNMIQQGISDRC